MSVKKLESYDMSNATYLEKRVGGEKTWVFFPPISKIVVVSHDVIGFLILILLIARAVIRPYREFSL